MKILIVDYYPHIFCQRNSAAKAFISSAMLHINYWAIFGIMGFHFVNL